MTFQQINYPVTYEVDTPETLSRWLWLFKWILVIPHLIILSILGFVALIAVFFAWFAIIFTGKCPRGVFDFVLQVMRWNARVGGYLSHFTDEYPPFSMDALPEYPVRLDVPYSDHSDRLTVFFRAILYIPHYIILGILASVIWLVMLVHIVIVVFTGKPNTGVLRFLVGYNRWNTRVSMYLLLATDKYPPFSLD